MADMLNRYIDLMKYQKGEFFDETCRKFKNIDKENKYREVVISPNAISPKVISPNVFGHFA